MFRKKKETRTADEIRTDRMLEELARCNVNLSWTAKKAYIRHEALCCYIPGSPDYDAAFEELRMEQVNVRNHIAAYDDKRAEILRVAPSTNISTSHEVIRIAIRDFFK